MPAIRSDPIAQSDYAKVAARSSGGFAGDGVRLRQGDREQFTVVECRRGDKQAVFQPE